MSVMPDLRCVMPDVRCVMPDVLGHPVSRRDCRSKPAMTGKVGAGNDGEGRTRRCTGDSVLSGSIFDFRHT